MLMIAASWDEVRQKEGGSGWDERLISLVRAGEGCDWCWTCWLKGGKRLRMRAKGMKGRERLGGGLDNVYRLVELLLAVVGTGVGLGLVRDD